MSERIIKDFTLGDIESGETVVIFGAGDVAQLTYFALTSVGVDVAFFCDPILAGDAQDAHTIENAIAHHGVPIITSADLERLDPQSTCVFDAWDQRRYARQPKLLERFSRVFVSAALLQSMDLDEADVEVSRQERELRVSHYTSQCRALVLRSAPGALRLRSLDVVVTEACTMRCVDCSNLMQYYVHPRHSDLQELHTALYHLLAAVDGVDEFRVLGGEPFANPKVGQIVNKLTSIEDADRVVIYTNATIIPRGEVLSSLQHPKVIVTITNYGDLSKRHDELCEVLSKHEVNWLSQKPTWTDSGRIDQVERTPDELQRVFEDCCVNNLVTLLNGRLYLCPFSANAMNLSAVPNAPEDVIDLREDRPAEELRAMVSKLYGRTHPLTACSFCRGRDHTSPVIEPAIQVRRPLPLTVLSSGV
ncbi:radical SAM protein [Streptomyces rochei]|uniref:radical SAM protein n=1 Tax=Streptomyces rochei TaxID=1928 RepID=UPI0036B01B18